MVKLGATSFKQTRFGILPRDKVIELEILGTRKGFLFLEKESTKQEKISTNLIKKTHKICFADILQKEAGVFRTSQVSFSGKEAIHYSRVAEQMTNLCEDAETRIANLSNKNDDNYIHEVVKLLSWFQHRFVSIHPFIDYNGRLARLFTNYILMRLNLPIIEIKIENKEDRRKYIKALQKADNLDFELFEKIIATALNESLILGIKK